jgi:hypothetical protein
MWAEVAALCLILAVLVPLWMIGCIHYIRMSTHNEAGTNLRNLFQGAAAYYRVGAASAWPPPTATTPRACVVASAVTHNTPSDRRAVIDFSRESDSFAAIGFTLGDPVYYQYAITGSPGSFCGIAAGADLYRFQARGDRDGDGEQSLFELAAGSDDDNELIRAPGLYIVREHE